MAPQSPRETNNTAADKVVSFAALRLWRSDGIVRSLLGKGLERSRSSICKISSKDQQPECARPLNQVHASDQWLWLQEVDEQTPAQVRRHEQPEEHAVRMMALANPVQKSPEKTEKHYLVCLGRVSGDAISKINRPRQRGRLPIGIVRQPSQKTANTAHGDSDTEWDRKEVSAACGDALQLLS